MTAQANRLASGFQRLSTAIPDPLVSRAVRALEDKLIELERRVADAEKRLTDGAL